MSTMRLFTRITGIFVLLIMLFGAEVLADSFTWTGSSAVSPKSWTDAANWTPALGNSGPQTYPIAGDDATFPNAPAGSAAVEIPTAGVAAANIYIMDNYEFTMRGNIVTTNFDIAATYTLALVSNAGLIEVDGAFTLATGAEVVGTGTSSVYMYMDGTIAAADLTASVGEKIILYVRNVNMLASDLVVYGHIDLGYVRTNNKQITLYLGGNDLYLGADATIMNHTTDVGSSYGFIQTLGGDCVSSTAGRLCKEATSMDLTGTGAYFTFPVGEEGELYTPITLGITCLSDLIVNPAGFPFAFVSVRAEANWGTLKGHPDNQQSAKVGVYWPVKGKGLPEDANPDPLGLPIPRFGFSGLMEFANTYRNSQPDSLFSAIYKMHIEDDAACGTSGPFNGFWDLKGSQTVQELTGNFRTIPFGQYVPGTPPTANPLLECMYGYGDISGGVKNGGTIPVELTSFSARYYDGSVRLHWQTATELNNHGFYVERSLDGENWEDINFIEGAGTSNVPLEYNFTDVLDGMLQEVPQIAYRLRQEDRDGTIDYSGIVYAYTGVQPDRVALYKAYPNPFNPSTTLSFSLQDAAHVTLKVYNTFGQEVATVSNADFDAGFHTVEFQGAQLPSGVYIAVLEAAGAVQQQKLVLNK